MGITKDYLRFIPSSKCNIIASSNCNIARIKCKDDDKHIRFIATGAAEDVIIWDCKLSKRVRVIEGDKYECWSLATTWRTDHLAVGYRNGTVELYNSATGEHRGTFSGHTSPVSTLVFDNDGHRLASGSMDTEVVVWDIVAEQGLFRLSGHKGPITQVRFMSTFDVIVTSSKDTFIKFWDLKNGHCFKTLTGHVTEVWSFTLLKDDSYLVSGTNDSELRVWKILDKQTSSTPIKTDDIENFGPLECVKVGSILRQGFGRVMSLTVDDSSQILCCHGNEKLVELFHFVPEDEAVRRYHKKQKKMRKKQEQTGEEESFSLPPADALTYHISRLAPIRTLNKVRSVIVSFEEIEKKVKVVTSTNSNTVEIHSFELSSKESQLERLITGPGHNADVRCIAFDESDSATMVSGSANSLKVWNRPLSHCVRTIETDYVLSICFATDGRYVLAGLKTGALIIVDIATSDIIETIDAHSKETSHVSVLPNKLGCITCGGDSTVKIWNFEWSAGFLSLLHTRTLKLEESILDVRVSPDSHLISAALLDSTVKIFYTDTFKFFLCLHGHKLPVTCFDISYDSTIIATGSSDRSIKIWGLDFGDCHKSIYAHEYAVTGLRFIPNTHQFFTCGKDGTLKQWDADNYQRILTLCGHRGEAWSLDISRDGSYVVSVGHDRVIRVYEKSDEPLVLEDEREVERQEEEEKTLATGAESVLHGRGTIALASKKTVNAEKGAELLLECLQVIREYEKPATADQSSMPLPPILAAFNAKNCDQYLIAVLRKIRTSDFEEILSMLPFNETCQLLRRLLPLLNAPHHETETVCRTIVFLLRAHHKPLISSQNLMLTLQKLEALSLENIQQLKDTVGYNLHALLCLQKEKEVTFDELIFDSKQKAKRRKQKLIKTTLMKL